VGCVPALSRVDPFVDVPATLLTMFLVALVPLAPTEPVLTGMGVLAATNHVSPLWFVAVAAFGCTLSDHALYLLGRFGGRRALDRLRRRPSVDLAADFLSRHSDRWGAPILVIGRWIPGGGTVGSVLAGSLRWPLVRFTPTSVIGSTLWSAYVVLLGYLGGTVTGQPVIGILVSVGVALLIGLVAARLLRRNRAKPQAEDSAAVPSGAAARAGSIGPLH
jgi:membrane protein DedA with SNARE-associated domain